MATNELKTKEASKEAMPAEALPAEAMPGVTAPLAKPAKPSAKFTLSEGDRAELEMRGVANVNGHLMTRDEVKAKLDESQPGHRVELGTAGPADVKAADRARRGCVEGIDFVWPSVDCGYIDPAVAGTPGINGPSADEK
jgi:hypothetical protein